MYLMNVIINVWSIPCQNLKSFLQRCIHSIQLALNQGLFNWQNGFLDLVVNAHNQIKIPNLLPEGVTLDDTSPTTVIKQILESATTEYFMLEAMRHQKLDCDHSSLKTCRHESYAVT